MAEGSSGGGFNEVWWVIGIFLLVFVAWVVTGGPSKPIASGGFFLTSPRPLSTGEATGTGADLSYTAPRFGPNFRTRSSDSNSSETDQSFESSARSPYRGDISLTVSGRNTGETDPEDEYIRLSNHSRDDIDISGWVLVSTQTGEYGSIPQGMEVLHTGSSLRERTITLASGDSAYVVSGRSPVGTSFRLNMCTGYLEEFQNFTPTLPQECPSAEDDLEDFSSRVSNSCEEFVEDIDRCEIPGRIPSSLSSSCEDFIEDNLHYNGCVDNHEDDRSFLEDEWRIYLGSRDELWRGSRETIRLLDENGRVVDQVSY